MDIKEQYDILKRHHLGFSSDLRLALAKLDELGILAKDNPIEWLEKAAFHWCGTCAQGYREKFDKWLNS